MNVRMGCLGVLGMAMATAGMTGCIADPGHARATSNESIVYTDRLEGGHMDRHGGGHGMTLAETGISRQQFERADSNGNGLMDRNELALFESQQFARYDANGNGVMDQSEFSRLEADHRR